MGHAARVIVKRIYLTLILLLMLWPQTVFAALPRQVTDALPPDVQQALEESEDTGENTLLQNGWARLRETAISFFTQQLHGLVRGAAAVLAIVMLCNLCGTALQAVGNNAVPNYVPLAGALAVTAAAAGSFHSLAKLCAQTVEQMHILSETLLPAMASAMTASGGALSATARQLATVFFSELLISAIHRLFLPLTYAFIAASAAEAVLQGNHMKSLAEMMKKGITWALTSCVVLFTGYLSLSGAAAGSADRAALQMTRSVISAAVPVVGGIISEASGTLLSGAGVLRGTLGVAGMLGILSICIVPFLSLLAQFLLYKAAAFLCGVMGDLLVEYLHALGDAYALLLGMTGSCAALLLISVATSVSVVIV